MVPKWLGFFFFTKKVFCLMRLPLYIYSSSTEAPMKFPKGKGIRKLSQHIVRIIKNASIRVLENSDLQCRNAGILSRSNACHVVHASGGYGHNIWNTRKLSKEIKQQQEEEQNS